MKKLITCILFLVAKESISQDSTRKLSFSGYVEIYYLYDFNKPIDHNRPNFIYSHSRHNEFTLNLGFIKANYTNEKIRANLSLAAGTYMNANYATEPGVLKNLFEANLGIRLGKNNLWLDVGILPSHIGFESAISNDCWTLTRSILADNSPYYEAGAKITYLSKDKKWLFSGMALNGWQRISRMSGNSSLGGGTQIQFRPSEKILLNSSAYFGSDKPDSARLMRLFHNFYCVLTPGDKFGITFGFDIGAEEKSPTNSSKNIWYSPALLLKYSIDSKWMMAVRGEYFRDKNSVLINTGNANEFETVGFSLNIDHKPSSNILARIEIRNFKSELPLFTKGSQMVNSNTSITTSLALSF